MKRVLFCLYLILSIASESAFAIDPLLLTESEMQKLHQYFPSEDEESQLVWKGDALAITLPIGQEKRLIFSEPIQADLNGKFTDQLRIINNDQSLYLTAQKEFSAIRMYVRLKNSQEIILLDLSTAENASNKTRTITTPKNSVIEKTNSTSINNNALNNNSSADTYVNAIRFAWQQLYAPQRLLNDPSNFTEKPMHTNSWESSLVYGDKVLAHPEVSWVANGLYITAVELRNKYSHITTVDAHKDLCGSWQAATLYPRHTLKPAGNKAADSTMLLLISSKPFGDVLEVCHGRA